MNPRSAILMGAAAAAVASVSAVWAWRRFLRWRRQKDPDEIERLRRLDVNRRGRITAAEIVDLVEPEEMALKSARRRCMIVYKYEVAGVTYEVPQDVSALPVALAASRSLAHQSASVKYDPRAPTNSIIACEDWNGMAELKATAKAADQIP